MVRFSIILVVSGFLSSCVSYKRVFQAPWSQPLDLRLNRSSLAGSKVDVRCSNGLDDNQNHILEYRPSCEAIAKALNRLGATIVGPYREDQDDEGQPLSRKPNKADIRDPIRLIFVENPWSSVATSYIPFLLTFFIWPRIQDDYTTAKLILKSAQKQTVLPMKIYRRQYHGLLALYPLTIKKNNENYQQWEYNLGNKLIQSIANHVYSFDFE